MKSRALDFNDPADNVYAFAKMYGTLGEQIAYPAFKGTMFAVVGDAKPKPLFGYTGFGTMRSTLLSNGHVRFTGKELGVFTDLVTGEVLTHWHNPFTGETVEVLNLINPHQQMELTLEMPVFNLEGDDHGTLMNEATAQRIGKTVPFVLPWDVVGDTAMLTWEYLHRYRNPLPPELWPRESTGEFINPSEHFCFAASLAELENRDLPSARFSGGFFRQSPWWPWMLMGDSGIQGWLFSRCHSYKAVAGVENIPPKVRAFAEKHYPENFELPNDWNPINRTLTTWEAYQQQRHPAQPRS